MSAIDDFATLVETTEPVKQVIKSVREGPARLLRDVCQTYQRTGQRVPDHNLDLVGYLAETSLAALISLNLITQHDGGTSSIYAYEPTAEGLKQYEKLKADGFYKK